MLYDVKGVARRIAKSPKERTVNIQRSYRRAARPPVRPTIICVDSYGVVTAVIAAAAEESAATGRSCPAPAARSIRFAAMSRPDAWLAAACAASRGDLDASDLYDDVVVC